ncbi:MAG: hypothetical protein WCA91_16300 [Candidatus Acidiferrales bacterium]
MTRPLGCALAVVILSMVPTAKADGTVNVKCGVNEDRVWVYESLVDFNVAAKLKCGEPVQIVGRVKGYAKIATSDGTEGYVVDTAFPKSALPPEPEEKTNDVQSASLAFAARRASRSSAKSPVASTAPSDSESTSPGTAANNPTPADNEVPSARMAGAATARPDVQRQVAMAVSTPPSARAAIVNASTAATSAAVAIASAATDAPSRETPAAAKPQTVAVAPAPASTPGRAIEAPRVSSSVPVIVASNAASSVPASSNASYAQPPAAISLATIDAPRSTPEVIGAEPLPAAPAPLAPKVSASNSVSHPAPSRTMGAEPNTPSAPEITVSATMPHVATPTNLPPTPKVEAAMSAPVAPTRAPASALASNSVATAPVPAVPATAALSVAVAPAPVPAPPAPTTPNYANSNPVGQNRSASAVLQPVSNLVPRPDAGPNKPVVNPDDEEEGPSVKALENEAANCTVFFTAYGLSPNQYKWIAQNRLKAFPSVCPAPSPAMVDFVVIFTHDVAFYSVTMPDVVHFETNGFSDWTPLTSVDTALMNASDADKSHHEYVWVFHTTRGAFDPAKFSARRRPLYSKAETNTLGSRGGFRTVMDALTFIEQKSANR